MAKKAQVYEQFKARYDAVASDWNDRMSEYVSNYRQMLGMDVMESKPWGAKVNSQHTHAQVMTYCAFIQAGLTPTWPWFFAEMPEPWRELESRATEEFNVILRNMGYYRFQFLWLRLAASFKLGVAKLTFGEQGPVMTHVHPGNFMWDPAASNLRYDADWVIEVQRRKSLRMHEALFKAGDYTCSKEDFKKFMDWDDNEQSAKEQMRAERMGADQGSQEGKDLTPRTFIHTTRESIQEIHDESQIVLRDIPNPYGHINYYDMTAFPEAFEVEGYGIPDLARDLQDEINTLRRQRIDVRSLVANPMFKLLKGAGLDPFQLISSPGAVFPVNAPDDISTIPIQDNSMALQAEEGLLTQDFDRLVGVMGQTRGEPGKAGLKATVASINAGNTNVRFGVQINMLQDYPIRPLMADLVELAALIETPRQITQQEWALVRERAEQGELTLVTHSESYIGNAVEKFQLLTNWAQNFLPMMAPQGMAEIAKETLALLQVRDPERITRFIVGNMTPDPVDAAQMGGPGQQMPAGAQPGMTQGPQTGRGVGLVEEQARAMAPGQAGKPMAGSIPA